MELPTEQQAKRVAEEMAKQIVSDVEEESFKEVVVKTQTGKVVHKSPIKHDSKGLTKLRSGKPVPGVGTRRFSVD